VDRGRVLGRSVHDLVLLTDDDQRAVRLAGPAAAVSHHAAHALSFQSPGFIVPLRNARVNGVHRLIGLASPSDTKSLIETAVNRFLDEVPALQPLKLVAGLELRGRGDVQIYRVELPGPKVSKDLPSDAKVQLSIGRAQFNDLATKGQVSDWRAAFAHGDVKATGIEQVMKLIVNVVERQEERSRTRKAKH
jgi:hypothetical protein